MAASDRAPPGGEPGFASARAPRGAGSICEVSDRVGDDQLRAEIAAHPWYHTLELRPGIETPGWFDLRGIIELVPLPGSLVGKRCLDVGTFDGFWAFEMERRGAEEVVAIDVLDPSRWDWPAGSDDAVITAINARKAGGVGFELTSRELGSAVQRRPLSVYELDPDEIGQFDHIYLGSLLLHLRDPVLALERVCGVCSGTLIVCDAIDAAMTAVFRKRAVAHLDGRGRPWWWKPNLAGLVRMVEAAGFETISPPVRLRMPPGAGHPKPILRPRSFRSQIGRVETMRAWRGDPHAIVYARPRVGPQAAGS